MSSFPSTNVGELILFVIIVMFIGLILSSSSYFLIPNFIDILGMLWSMR